MQWRSRNIKKRWKSVAKVVVTADQWVITEEIANEFGISNGSAQSILKEMAVQNFCRAFWQMTIEIGNVIVAKLFEWLTQEADVLSKIITNE